ncbi:hypothetical protein DFA_05775 [Cavenderia fasciculata]|uniref:Sodium/calcium exchanger membrane region domain-containing protein n=1 Tax=Cavenderia fasciculata TaxID=261658 RepID=F4PMJ4_CACFS|nr:uncharacterized protein DFA_05775 [Cavenderia fasciculata]EGG23641.1 hypothetical protein DFA_05775 [Cavenderia fasciculata]|eukprot:XP_004361492.1 hypothetical protein DFA_05775 [Cavenderia fasciculata]
MKLSNSFLLTILLVSCYCLTLSSAKNVKHTTYDDQLQRMVYDDAQFTINTTATCTTCTGNLTYWCASSSNCLTALTSNITLASFPQCGDGWCSGSSCQCDAVCLNSFWPCSGTVGGMILLMAIYGAILAFGAKIISDGSELLMEVIDAGIIGGLLLPLLSAFPDAMIIIMSGAFSSDPQTQLAVGIGTLAGSTIMLLTIPWSASMVLARCDLKDNGNGAAIDNKCSSFSLTKTGVTVDDDTPTNAKIMILTSISYLIVQGVAFAYLKDPERGQGVEKWFALVGFIICFALLILYSVYQVVSPKLQEKKIAEAKRQYLTKQTIHHFIHNLNIMSRKRTESKSPSITGNNNTGESDEHSPLIQDEHQKLPVDVKGMGLKWKANAKKKALAKEQEAEASTSIQVKEEEPVEKEEEKPASEEVHNKKKTIIHGSILLAIGSVMVSVFSDPMVDVITDFGTKLDINLFFISFIVTPFCSNASELISSLIFASKKRKQNSSLTYSALYGSATMNNTLCLGIFFALVYFRDLTWEFSAETVTILFVTVCVGLIGSLKKTMKLYLAPLVLSLYPFSLVIVYLLETFAHWQ